jgi:hypothetical protein
MLSRLPYVDKWNLFCKLLVVSSFMYIYGMEDV